MGGRSDNAAVTRQLADVAVRLHNKFSPHTTFAEILAIVDSCRRDLDIASTAGLPELVERLATQRILDRIGGGT